MEERDTFTIAVGQWTFGYLSGRNAELPRAQRKELTSLDNDVTARHIVAECVINPNFTVYEIADTIFDAAPSVSVGT